MQCKEVELVVEQEGLAPLPEAARAHLAGCGHCREFVADLAAIVSVANELPAEVEPPTRVWISLQAQLELEGIIKTPVVAARGERSPWWHGLSDLFRSRALATAAVGLLIVAAGVQQLRQPPDASLEAPGSVAGPVGQIPFAQTAKVLNEQEIDLRNMQLAGTSAVDTSFRQNLQQVDDFIADCERRVNAAPQDDLAREYLSNAYQQKAELLSAMMDREGSVH
jgi:negative regulator of sigma E activity